MSILYITQNGVTDHIGRSQVAPYVLALAKQGYSIHVLSAEKAGKDALIDEYQGLFDAAGVSWTRIHYHNRPPLISTIYDLMRMYLVARKIVKTEAIRLVHCRSFPPAVIGHRLKRVFGTKFIFDFRDFYADGGIVNKPFKPVYRYLKRLEGPMIRAADKVVCLTHRAQALLTEWYLADRGKPEQHFQVIPCCADFDHFDLSQTTQHERRAARRKADLVDDDFVLLYLGSLGSDYLLPDMMRLFSELRGLQPRARFLFVSNNGAELVEAECAAQGIPRESIRFLSADRREIPALISLADLSVIFIRPDVSKAGCSPTKLAELFACNVPVITNSGVGDLDEIIRLQQNGSVAIQDFANVSMRAALEQVIAVKANGSTDIRENSREFALEAGVEKYEAVYQQLLGR